MRKFGKSFLVYALSGMLILPPAYTANATPAVDGTIYKGGNIYTLNETHGVPQEELAEVLKNATPKTAEVVVTAGGKIVFVGDEAGIPSEYKNNKVVNLMGKTMLPGFVDAHGHYPGFALYDLHSLNLNPSPINDVDSLEILYARVKAYSESKGQTSTLQKGADTVPTFILGGAGYDDTLIGGHPNADKLQEAAGSGVAVTLSHSSGHFTALSREFADAIGNPEYMVGKTEIGGETGSTRKITAIEVTEAAYIITFDGPDSKDESTKSIAGVIAEPDPNNEGKFRLTGLLAEPPAMSLTSYFPAIALTGAQYADMMKYGSDIYAAAGVTSADASYSTPSDWALYRQQIAQDRMNVRVIVHPTLKTEVALEQLGWTTDRDPVSDALIVTAKAGNTPNIGDDVTKWSGSTKAMMDTTALKGEFKFMSGVDATDEQIAKLDNMLLLGQHKLAVDGSNQGYTGYFKFPGYYFTNQYDAWDPYKDGIAESLEAGRPDEPNADKLLGLTGTLVYKYNYLQDMVSSLHKYGQGVTIHTNGSRANEMVVAAFEETVWEHKDAGITDTRSQIIHAQMQERQQTQRLVGNHSDILLSSNASPDAAIKAAPVFSMVEGAEKTTYDEYVADSKLPGNLVYQNLDGIMFDLGTEDPESSVDVFVSNIDNKITTQEEREELSALMKAQNYVSSYFVDHTYYWGDRHKNIFMGPGVAQQISPLGWAVEYGHRYTSHNDCPVTPMLPLRIVEQAVTRTPYQQDYNLTGTSKDLTATTQFPVLSDEAVGLGGFGENVPEATYWDFDQRVNVLQALHATTYNAAYQNHVEDKIGHITEGLLADFVILDQNPFDVNPDNIADIRVATTIVGDEVVYGILPGGNAFAQAPGAAILQKNAVAVTMKTVAAVEEDKAYIPQDDEAVLGSHSFTAFVNDPTGTTPASFEMTIFGNGEAVKDLRLIKIDGSGSVANEYTRLNAGDSLHQDGKFWVTKVNQPGQILGADEVLKMDEQYYVFFSILDGGAFDADNTADGSITDPLALVSTSGSVPTNGTTTPADSGSSGGGCTVGSDARYDLLFLLIAAGGLMLIRARRREDA